MRETNTVTSTALAYALAATGRQPEAEKELAELRETAKSKFISPFGFCVTNIALGKLDDAMDDLERPYQIREDAVCSMLVNPRLDPLRSNPKYSELMRRIGLPL